MFAKRLKEIFSLMLALALLLSLLPAAAGAEEAPEAALSSAKTPETGETAEPETRQLLAVVKYTSYGRINMRAKPDEHSARIGVLSGGTQVKVLEQGEDRWVLVEGEEKIGYMSSNFLEFFYEGDTPPIPVKSEPQAQTAQEARETTQESKSVPVVPMPVTPMLGLTGTQNVIMYVETDNGKSLNLRAGPSMSYAIIASYRVGTAVRVLARQGAWAYVSVGSRTGYMMLCYLSFTKPSRVLPYDPDLPVIAIVTVVHPRGSFVNLRSSTTTDTNDNILARIPHGTRVELLVHNFWYSLIRYNGITGYIVTSYLDFGN